VKKFRLYFIIAVMAAFFLLAVAPVSSVSITESPEVLNRGGQVTITMNDLNDGAQFSLLIDGEFNALPGQRFSFQTNSFTMPVDLNSGQISATTRGTEITAFSVQKNGGATVNVINSADSNGFFSLSQPYSITSGLYNYLKLEGKARSDVTTIMTSMNLVGTKQGPKNSQITFAIDGIDNGLVRLTILVDGQAALPTKTIRVGSGLTPVPTVTTPAPTTVPTTTVVTTMVTATGTTTATQTSATTATTTETTTATTATTTETTTATTATTAPLVKTFYSADQKVSLATQGVDYAGFLMVKSAVLPENWLAISDVYTIAPGTLVFSPQATLAFTIPETSSAGYAYFVGRYENNLWTSVPSTAGTATIETKISRPATYGLMAYKPESSVPVYGATTPSGTPVVQGTPKIASIAAVAPVATTKQAPLDVLLLFGALATGMGILLINKK
jgi:hypothetical protein